MYFHFRRTGDVVGHTWDDTPWRNAVHVAVAVTAFQEKKPIKAKPPSKKKIAPKKPDPPAEAKKPERTQVMIYGAPGGDIELDVDDDTSFETIVEKVAQTSLRHAKRAAAAAAKEAAEAAEAASVAAAEAATISTADGKPAPVRRRQAATSTLYAKGRRKSHLRMTKVDAVGISLDLGPSGGKKMGAEEQRAVKVRLARLLAVPLAAVALTIVHAANGSSDVVQAEVSTMQTCAWRIMRMYMCMAYHVHVHVHVHG